MTDTLILNGKAVSPESLPELLGAEEPWLRQLGEFLHEWWDEKPDMDFQTSGSTGKPKTVRFTKDQCRESARRTLTYFNIPVGGTALLCLPTTYVAGKMMVVRALVGSLNLVAILPSSNPWPTSLPPIDFAAVTPHQLASLDARTAVERTMRPTGVLLVGGAPLSPALEASLQKINCRIYETYGMTETLTHVAVRRLGSSGTSVFSAIPDVALSTDSEDCLVIRAEYLGSHPVHTRDRVRMVGEHQFQWLGRHDRVINSGGIKIHPEEVEAQIGMGLQKQPFFIHPLPDERFGEKVVLWVEGESTPILEKHISELLETITGPEKPREYHILPQFQRTTTGKIDRQGTVETWLRRR